jgi:hypothetical protein
MRLPDALQSTIISGACRRGGSSAGSSSRPCGNASRAFRRRRPRSPASDASAQASTRRRSHRPHAAREPWKTATPVKRLRTGQAVGALRVIPSPAKGVSQPSDAYWSSEQPRERAQPPIACPRMPAAGRLIGELEQHLETHTAGSVRRADTLPTHFRCPVRSTDGPRRPAMTTFLRPKAKVSSRKARHRTARSMAGISLTMEVLYQRS